jgi:hypothetical protein
MSRRFLFTGMAITLLCLAALAAAPTAFALEPGAAVVDPPAVEPPPPPPPPDPPGSGPTDPPPSQPEPPQPPPPPDPEPVGSNPDPSPPPSEQSSAKPNDSFDRQGGEGSTSGSPSNHSAGAVTGTGTPSKKGGTEHEAVAIAPTVDDFDDFGATNSGGTGVLTGGSVSCSFCGQAAGGLILGRVAAATRLEQRHTELVKHGSRAAELPEVVVPGTPGQLPGRAFTMPGGTGGVGVAFVLLSLFAFLATARSRINFTTSFELPTATWRLSGYVPPIESPG